MSMVETIRDVKNNLLSRREITCTFKGLAGKLKKLEAVDIVSKQYKLDGKVIVPIMLKNETGRPMISGTFYVYDDEKLARAHLKPAIFERLKPKGGGEKTEGEVKEAPAEKTKEKPEAKKEAPAEKKEAKAPDKKETKAPEEKKEKPAKKESAEPKEKSK